MYHCLVETVENSDLEIVEFNDRYLEPLAGGYRDLQVLIAYHGYVCELRRWLMLRSQAGTATLKWFES